MSQSGCLLSRSQLTFRRQSCEGERTGTCCKALWNLGRRTSRTSAYKSETVAPIKIIFEVWVSQEAALNSGVIFIVLGWKMWSWEQFEKRAPLWFWETHLAKIIMAANGGQRGCSLCLKPHSWKSLHVTGLRDTLFESREAALRFEHKMRAVGETLWTQRQFREKFFSWRIWSLPLWRLECAL